MTCPLLFNRLRSDLQQTGEQGFGLLSLVFLTLTISIAAVTIMTVINPSALTRQSRETADKARILRAAIQSYQFSHGGVNGSYPANLDVLVTPEAAACLINNDPTQTTYLLLQGWCGPYVDTAVAQNLTGYKTDGWGTLFGYNAGTGIVTSCGPDKSCGGADDVVFNP